MREAFSQVERGEESPMSRNENDEYEGPFGKVMKDSDSRAESATSRLREFVDRC